MGFAYGEVYPWGLAWLFRSSFFHGKENRLSNIHLNAQISSDFSYAGFFWANEPADSFGCERSGNCLVLWQEEVKMATAQVGLWTLLSFVYLLWLRMLTLNSISLLKIDRCYYLPNQIVYLYVLGTEWWCFETKCQSFRPKRLLAWNRVSLSKQVPTRIRGKGGFYEFLFCFSVCP